MATNSIWTTRRGVHHRELAGEQPERTEIRLAEGELAGHGRPGSTSVPAKTRSAAPRSISDGPFLSNFPTSAPSASPTVQRQPMPMYLPLSSSVPQPVKSPHPVDPHLWHSFGQGRLSRRRSAQAKPVQRPSECRVDGRNGSGLTMTVPIAAVTSCRWLRAPDRLVVIVRWCILKSIRGRN